MNQIQQLMETRTSLPYPLHVFAINLLLSAVLSFLLGRVYILLGRSLSNRREFANNFIMMTMTTMVVIAIIQTSLVLSLGLVGALSIVRYRAAIKEPEELSYLFLAIALGLGMGADQRIITLIGFAAVVAVLWIVSLTRRGEDSRSLHLTVSGGAGATLEAVSAAVKEHAAAVNLVRFEEDADSREFAFGVEFTGADQLEACRAALREIDPDVRITFMDLKGLS